NQAGRESSDRQREIRHSALLYLFEIEHGPCDTSHRCSYPADYCAFGPISAGAAATNLRISSGGTVAVSTARSFFCAIFRLSIAFFISGSDAWPPTEISAERNTSRNAFTSCVSCSADCSFGVKASAWKCTPNRGR